jgi:hypothetical protein
MSDFNIHKWNKSRYLKEGNIKEDNYKLVNSISNIADMYSYGEILDALESFYIKNDEHKSAKIARKHAKEFRDMLDPDEEEDFKEIPGFEGTMKALDDLTINEKKNLNESSKHQLNQLSWDFILRALPGFGEEWDELHLETPTDADRVVSNERSFDMWLEDMVKMGYGKEEVIIDPEGKDWMGRVNIRSGGVKIIGDKFTKDKQEYIDGKAATLKSWGTTN